MSELAGGASVVRGGAKWGESIWADIPRFICERAVEGAGKRADRDWTGTLARLRTSCEPRRDESRADCYHPNSQWQPRVTYVIHYVQQPMNVCEGRIGRRDRAGPRPPLIGRLHRTLHISSNAFLHSSAGNVSFDKPLRCT